MDYAKQTPYSDPGEYAHLFDALPDDIPAIGAVVRNLLIHYRGGGIEFTGDRLAEIDNRWVSAILATDQRRNGTALAVPREAVDHVVGCCRDYTLLFVSALRHKGIPARSRIGFAVYFGEGFNFDHVVAEYWNGDRWVMTDAQLDPADGHPFNTLDMPPGPFVSAAEVWRDARAGRIDPDLYGVQPGLAITGDELDTSRPGSVALGGLWFIRTYVHHQLAHLMGDELLLWEGWGTMAPTYTEADAAETDELAALLIAADTGDTTATQALTDRYPALAPNGRTLLTSPSGHPHKWVDLTHPLSE
ncbi:transglutaminase-like domain-containing protein [Kribbella sp. NBC_01505]|uniref:transglutaminase-like domain-containing protein n=1 Tax=Kribbella sp. NBC_01505 TaxID=2903580 RepID=UPI0038667847